MNRLIRIVLPLSGLLMLAGCGVQPGSNTTRLETTGVTGMVHGGQQPVANATIQLYAVGTTGDGSAATPLLSPAVTTDAGGGFSLSPGGTKLYSCTNATEVYLTATGGNPGGSTPNPNLALMVALGPCSSLTTGTFIQMNELTTVAAVSALAPYMTSFSAVGSGTGDAGALASAFTLASELVNPATGTTPGANVPAGMSVPTALIITLGDIVGGCINSTGGLAGSNTPCGNLFTLTTPPSSAAPTDTIMALLDLANNPTLNTTALFGLLPPDPAFQPPLTVAPADFGVRLTPAALLLNPSGLSFGSIPLGGTSAAQNASLANTTTASVALTGVALTGANAGDFAVTNSCPSTLVKGTVCMMAVTFSPSVAAAESATLVVTEGGSVTSIPLSGTGVAAGTGPVTLSPTSLVFNDTSVPQVVTLTNYGTTPIGISAINISSGFYSQINNCGSSLSGQSICNIYVSVAGGAGGSAANLTVVDSDTTDAQTVAITAAAGSDQGYPVKDFGGSPVGTPGQTIAFTGGVHELLNGYYNEWYYSLTFEGSNPVDFGSGGSCVWTTGPCYIGVRFTPQAAGYRFTAAVGNDNSAFLFKGYGVVNTKYFFFATPLVTFGSEPLGSSTSQELSIVNGSTVQLSFPFQAAVTVTGGSLNNGDITVTQGCAAIGGSATNVNSGDYYAYLLQSCPILITFTPKSLGVRSATLTLTEASGQQQTAFIQGVGTYAAPALTATVAFGNVQVGTTSPTQQVTATLPNSHPATAQISGPGFALPGSAYCAQGAAPCQFGVNFTPSALGPATGTLTVTDTVSGIVSTTTLTGTGGVPTVSPSPTSLTFIPRTVATQSIAQTVTITNMGNAPLVVSSVGLGGTNPGDYSQTNTCTAGPIAVNGTCTISVTNTPTFVGPSSASVVIVSNAATSPNAIALSGNGQ